MKTADEKRQARMVRRTHEITADQDAALRVLHARTRQPIAVIVREALDAWIEAQKGSNQ